MEKLNEIKIEYTSDYIDSLVKRQLDLLAILDVQCKKLAFCSESSDSEFRNCLSYIIQLDTEIQIINDFLLNHSSDSVENKESEV